MLRICLAFALFGFVLSVAPVRAHDAHGKDGHKNEC